MVDLTGWSPPSTSPSPRPVYGRLPHPGHGGKRHRPPLHLCPTVSTILDREYVIKDGKYLKMTPLGDVVNDLMCHRFPRIVDVKFTAHMEEELDEVESGDCRMEAAAEQFYGGFRVRISIKWRRTWRACILRSPTRSARRSVTSAAGTWSSSPAGSAGSWPAPGYRGASSSLWWSRCRAAAPRAADGS